MPWVRFDDEYRNHPKISYAGKAGRELHTAIVFYCAKELTDGMIHINQIRRLAGEDEIDDWQAALERLTFVIPGFENALLTEGENGFFKVHDYEEYQPTREKVVADRNAVKDRMRTLRANRGTRAENVRGAHSAHIDRSAAEVRPLPNPDPVSRIPIPGPETERENIEDRALSNRPRPSSDPKVCAPHVDDVRQEMALQACNDRHAQDFLDHYESVGWVKGVSQTPIRNWRSIVREFCNRREQFERDDLLKSTGGKSRALANAASGGLAASAQSLAAKIDARRASFGERPLVIGETSH